MNSQAVPSPKWWFQIIFLSLFLGGFQTKQASAQTPGCFTTNVPSSPLSYDVTSTTQTESYAVTFRCTDDGTTGGSNLSNVDLDVTLLPLTAPTAGPANLDLGSPNGVTHTISIGSGGSFTNLVDTQTTVNTSGSTNLVVSTAGGKGENLSLDGTGTLTVNIQSRFALQGSASEFAAGTYTTQFEVDATPVGGGTIANETTTISNTVSPSCVLDNVIRFRETATPYIKTGSEPNVSQLQASDTAKFDCNATTVDINFSVDSATYTPPTGGATNLTATHQFAYELNGNGFNNYSGPELIENQNTDDNGDATLTIRSTWTPNSDQLFASEYNAQTTVTITAK
ncbi:hypothetical protein [Picosynechococcus sp. PCC 73109]|uniref:hypothetical protein n=1 Tax=Picosynechococcus sp. PCC 73109 TaxID=374982 RepID=UPI0007458B3F|nr:hypothetical protein [Picosynechococcus sp. PCC 73109]AMA10148.1 hypothetical protein AWQ23_12935 [Picosynechococcus sp. PCC 73109]